MEPHGPAPATTRTGNVRATTEEADMPAQGSAEWRGDVATGTGKLRPGDTSTGRHTKEGCPVGRALAGDPDVTLDAPLVS